MSDKHLSELEWKKFAKGKELKDAAFVKALAALEKAREPDQQLAALDEIGKQADALRKAGKAEKDLAGWLDELDRAAQKQRKLSESEAKKLARAAQQKDEEDEEDESEDETPALLTSKLIPLVRQVRKGDVVLHALIATAGKDTALLLARRGIAPARRKLMADFLGASGGVKYVAGQCLFEDNTLTFVVESQAAGLAKKLKAALHAQCDMRLKVRVRGEDPSDVDEELDAESGEQGETEIEQEGAGFDPLQQAFETRLAELEPLLLTALKAKSGDASKLRAVADFAREKGRGGAFKPALQALEQLARLLAAPPSTTAPPTSSTSRESEGRESETQDDDAGPAFNARLARLMPQIKSALAAGGPVELKTLVAEAGELARKKDFDAADATLDRVEHLIGGGAFDEAAFRQQWAEAKAAWRAAVDTVNGQIAALQSALKKIDDVELHEIAEFGLAGVTGNFKVPMMAAIVEIDQARGGASLKKAAAKAGGIAKAFNAYLASEETVAVTDANEFGVPVTLRASLGKALSGIEAALAAVR